MFQLLLLPLAFSLPTSTTSPDNECGHQLNCEEHGEGWWPDPFNCRFLFLAHNMFYFPLRKFWHCERDGGLLIGHHLACEADMLFDLLYDGCNYAELTDCGERCNYINIIEIIETSVSIKLNPP